MIKKEDRGIFIISVTSEYTGNVRYVAKRSTDEVLYTVPNTSKAGALKIFTYRMSAYDYIDRFMKLNPDTHMRFNVEHL